MESISEIKLDLIKLITRISDARRLKSIYQVVASSSGDVKEKLKQEGDQFTFGQVEIREKVSKDQIFEEQGNKPLSFEEIQDIMTDEPWELSLEELLAKLD